VVQLLKNTICCVLQFQVNRSSRDERDCQLTGGDPSVADKTTIQQTFFRTSAVSNGRHGCTVGHRCNPSGRRRGDGSEGTEDRGDKREKIVGRGEGESSEREFRERVQAERMDVDTGWIYSHPD
jgi:hypothetical protein